MERLSPLLFAAFTILLWMSSTAQSLEIPLESEIILGEARDSGAPTGSEMLLVLEEGVQAGILDEEVVMRFDSAGLDDCLDAAPGVVCDWLPVPGLTAERLESVYGDLIELLRRGGSAPDNQATAGCWPCISWGSKTDSNGKHYIFWFDKRPSPYNTWMNNFYIKADAYGKTGVLISGWDLCLYGFCSPSYGCSRTWVCTQ